ncbi:MAG: hypothetical protein MZV64_23550 [Ignavibacteriales bacterium]|nr:hypothetical protein [Ignavibacteriales bacterium]
MFRVQAPDLPSDQRPPRYYWRGYTYDYFAVNQWYTTGSSLMDYSPADDLPLSPLLEETEPARFIFRTGELTFSLVYAPAQPVWFSRQGARATCRRAAGRRSSRGLHSPPACRRDLSSGRRAEKPQYPAAA